MRIGKWTIVCVLAVCGLQSGAHTAELKECVRLLVGTSGDATLTNVCSDRLNIIYCVDNADSPRSCALASLGVTTLLPGSAEPIAANDAGAVHWAVCVYPEAPVQWKPGPTSPYACRKTCVMC